MPKWLLVLLQAMEIFAKLLPIIAAGAAAFGPASAEVQDLVTSFTTDPSIPVPVQEKVSKFAKAHLALLAKKATADKSEPVEVAPAPA
jgi:hypothetical protein